MIRRALVATRHGAVSQARVGAPIGIARNFSRIRDIFVADYASQPRLVGSDEAPHSRGWRAVAVGFLAAHGG